MRVFLIFLLLSSLSCRSSLEEEVQIIRVDLNAPLDSAAFRNKISGIRFIPLETNGQSLIGKIGKCMINEGGIYILDGREQAVHRFDRDGRYLNTLHKLGRGLGEYTAITDISFTDRCELAVLDGVENQVLYYDSSFQYIHTLPVEGGDKFMPLPAQELVIYKDNPRLEEYGLIHYDGAGGIKARFLPGKKTNENRPSYLRYCHLWNYDDTLVIIPGFDYSIYRYSGDKFITSWRFDFGENNMPENLLQGKFQDVSRRLIQDQKSVQMLDRWTENSDWITFEAAGKPVWWNKQEQKAYLPGNGWEVPYSVLFLFAPYDYWEGKYYTVVSAGNLMNGIYPLLAFEPYLKKYPFLRQLEKLDLNESDNDVLVEILMK